MEEAYIAYIVKFLFTILHFEQEQLQQLKYFWNYVKESINSFKLEFIHIKIFLYSTMWTTNLNHSLKFMKILTQIFKDQL